MKPEAVKYQSKIAQKNKKQKRVLLQMKEQEAF